MTGFSVFTVRIEKKEKKKKKKMDEEIQKEKKWMKNQSSMKHPRNIHKTKKKKSKLKNA
jgi:hypothetical protein